MRTPFSSIVISSWDADHAYHFRERATVLLINIYRTPVSGVLRRKDSGFAVCGENLASVSQFVAGIRHGEPSSRVRRSLVRDLQKRAPANERTRSRAFSGLVVHSTLQEGPPTRCC